MRRAVEKSSAGAASGHRPASSHMLPIRASLVAGGFVSIPLDALMWQPGPFLMYPACRPACFEGASGALHLPTKGQCPGLPTSRRQLSDVRFKFLAILRLPAQHRSRQLALLPFSRSHSYEIIQNMEQAPPVLHTAREKFANELYFVCTCLVPRTHQVDEASLSACIQRQVPQVHA